MTKIIKEIPFGERTLTIETGEIARQASGAVLVSLDGTVVLVTVVAKAEAGESRGFFPLVVDYFERAYAAGKIPGGYFKREGRPGEHETLTARLIDRPLRPTFPDGFNNEVQVVATVLSLNPEVHSDTLAIIGASAALSISGIPFNGPVSAVRVGHKEGAYLLNPTAEQLEDSALNLVVAGTADAILMVESEVKELPEEVVLGAVLYGHEMMQPVIQAISELAKEVGNPPWDWQAAEKDETLETKVHELASDSVKSAYLINFLRLRYFNNFRRLFTKACKPYRE